MEEPPYHQVLFMGLWLERMVEVAGLILLNPEKTEMIWLNLSVTMQLAGEKEEMELVLREEQHRLAD